MIAKKSGKIRSFMISLRTIPVGAVVGCEIFQFFEHTGIYVGDGQIVELAGSGLVRSLSFNRFLADRSGAELIFATTPAGEIIGSEIAANRAIEKIYSYQDYDLLRNNCHRFTYSCISGDSLPLTSFFDLKEALARYWRFTPNWIHKAP
jgi:hypothetical protein